MRLSNYERALSSFDDVIVYTFDLVVIIYF